LANEEKTIMKQNQAWQEFAALSPELQRQILDFIAFLKTRSAQTSSPRVASRASLRREPLIGMWRGRKDRRDN